MSKSSKQRTNNENFFYNLTGRRDIKDIFIENDFHKAPHDWTFVYVDIVKSTEKILRGKYRTIHDVVAETLSSILSIEPDLYKKVPYYFGGDGLIMLIPPSIAQTVKFILRRAQRNSKQHKLEIRCCSVKISIIADKGRSIYVAKHLLGNKHPQGVFRGDGVQFVESMCKSNISEFVLNPKDQTILAESNRPSSSIWKPVTQQKTSSISLIVKTDRIANYADIIGSIESIFGHEVFNTPNDILCDNIKFDGSLKTVVQGTEQEVNNLKSYLESKYSLGELYYGLHLSEDTVATAVVNPNDHDHIYLVDGGEAGYTKASIGFKRQLEYAPM